jgi:2-polyprenyl-6-methoxyphenol hydroxylase-like FAD-dependent oxidoreductase
VVVVGARAAGAATAMLLGRLGHDVALVDRATFPSDTISTHQIARPGVVQLHRWGLLDAVLASGAPAIRQVSFTAADETITRTVKHRAGVDLLVAPRRYILDTIVAEAAVRAGVHLRQGIAVRGVCLDDTGRATGVYGRDRDGDPIAIRGRVIVGADGLASTVARGVGAEVIEDRGRGGAVRYTYYDGPAWNGIELFIADRALVGVFPTHHDQACVWVGTPWADATTKRFAADLEAAAPALAERLRSGRRTAPVLGKLRMPNHRRRAHGPGWALVGDAGHHRDAVTGYGLSDAYRDAEFLAVALDRYLRGDIDEATALVEYQRRRDSALREVFEVTCALSAFPPVPEFVERQRQLSRAIEVEATRLAALPPPGERELVHN